MIDALEKRLRDVEADRAAAQAQPTMPALTDAMRAVLRNEHCVYDSEDALYAALCDAAQAQSSGIPGELAEPSGNPGELDSKQDL